MYIVHVHVDFNMSMNELLLLTHLLHFRFGYTATRDLLVLVNILILPTCVVI